MVLLGTIRWFQLCHLVWLKRLQLWAVRSASGFRNSHCFYWDGEKGHKGKQAVYQNLTPGQITSDYLMNLGANLDR